MKKVYLIALLIALILTGIIIFFHKTELKFELVCKTENTTDFYPDAYTFLHSEKAVKSFIFKKFPNKCENFDFKKYSYVIVYGRKPKSMYYSYKTTWFDDKSDYYAPHWGSNVVFIDYKKESQGAGTFLYKVNRQENLRGFFGI